MKKIIIDGDTFCNLAEFYEEVKRKFTSDIDFEIGKNLDAFDDILYGGFGVYDYGEKIIIIWEGSQKSKINFSYEATVKYLKEMLAGCHPTNRTSVRERLALAEMQIGETLFDIIIEIIREHSHINFILR